MHRASTKTKNRARLCPSIAEADPVEANAAIEYLSHQSTTCATQAWILIDICFDCRRRFFMLVDHPHHAAYMQFELNWNKNKFF